MRRSPLAQKTLPCVTTRLETGAEDTPLCRYSPLTPKKDIEVAGPRVNPRCMQADLRGAEWLSLQAPVYPLPQLTSILNKVVTHSQGCPVKSSSWRWWSSCWFAMKGPQQLSACSVTVTPRGRHTWMCPTAPQATYTEGLSPALSRSCATRSNHHSGGVSQDTPENPLQRAQLVRISKGTSLVRAQNPA